MHKTSLFSTSLPTLAISYLFDHSHSNRCKVIAVVILTCIFLMISDVEHIFLYLWAICMSSSEKCLFSFNAGDIRYVGLILGQGRSPGEGHATHSSILAWRIPWTEETGRLQSTGPQRAGREWNSLAQHDNQWCWNLFMYLLAICMPSSEKCPFSSSAHF